MEPFVPSTTNNAINPPVNTVNTQTAFPVLANALTTASGWSMRVYNPGGNMVAIETGPTGTVASLTTSLLIPPGGVEVFGLRGTDTEIATIAAVAGTALNVTFGQGV